MKYIQLTDPAAEPLTTAEVKTQLRLETTADDTYIQNVVIPAVRDFAERHTRVCIAQRTFTATCDILKRQQQDDMGWWDGIRDGSITQVSLRRAIELPMPPLVSIEEVRSIDRNNASTVYASSNYYADTFSEPGRLILNEGSIWPANLRDHNSIEIDFTAGSLAADTPYMVKQALLQLAAHWYENREVVGIGTIAARIPVSALAILDRFKLRGL